jgi:hypothetical protein
MFQSPYLMDVSIKYGLANHRIQRNSNSCQTESIIGLRALALLSISCIRDRGGAERYGLHLLVEYSGPSGPDEASI